MVSSIFRELWPLLGGITVAICFIATGVVAWSLCPSVTLVHPAKTAGRNEMPFGRYTRVVPSNIDLVLDRGPYLPTRRGDLEDWIGN